MSSNPEFITKVKLNDKQQFERGKGGVSERARGPNNKYCIFLFICISIIVVILLIS